ncbi:MAG: GNAT family N-acetyltransferase [Clostridia bacterium]|nr:GNAT family N-acetyltransferase [Clostridia bacterium]
MKLDITGLSSCYTVKRLTENDIPNILELCESNPLYYKYFKVPCTADSVKEDLKITPPGKCISDKYYVGFYSDGKLFGVLDIVCGYPCESTAYIGFFMLHSSVQGKGKGSSIIDEVCGYLKEVGFKKVRLAILRGNPQAGRFWTKNGFKSVETVKKDYGVVVVSEKEL